MSDRTNTYTYDVYDGVNHPLFKTPVSKLEISREEQIALILRQIEVDTADRPQHKRIMELAKQHVEWAYDYCLNEVDETKEYQKQVHGEDYFKKYTTSGWEDEDGEWHRQRMEANGDEEKGWELWKMDHGFDQDTLSFYARVLTNKIKWSL